MFPTLIMSNPLEGETPGVSTPARPEPNKASGYQSNREIMVINFDGDAFSDCETIIWLYMSNVAKEGASYCFIASVLELGVVLNRQMPERIHIYGAADFKSRFVHMLAPVPIDFLKYGVGYWFHETRNIMAVLMAAQVLMFFAMKNLCTLVISLGTGTSNRRHGFSWSVMTRSW